MAVPGPSYSFTVRVQSVNRPGMVGDITSAIGRTGGDIGAIDIVSANKNAVIRDYTVNAGNVEHSAQIVGALKAVAGVEVQALYEPGQGLLDVAAEEVVEAYGDDKLRKPHHRLVGNYELEERGVARMFHHLSGGRTAMPLA